MMNTPQQLGYLPAKSTSPLRFLQLRWHEQLRVGNPLLGIRSDNVAAEAAHDFRKHKIFA
jgi:hypothetical protein